MQHQDASGKRGYKYLVIDTYKMSQQLELRYLLDQIGPIYSQVSSEDRASLNKLDIIVFYVENSGGQNTPELLREQAGEANIQIVLKPVNEAEIKTLFLESPTQVTTQP